MTMPDTGGATEARGGEASGQVHDTPRSPFDVHSCSHYLAAGVAPTCGLRCPGARWPCVTSSSAVVTTLHLRTRRPFTGTEGFHP